MRICDVACIDIIRATVACVATISRERRRIDRHRKPSLLERGERLRRVPAPQTPIVIRERPRARCFFGRNEAVNNRRPRLRHAAAVGNDGRDPKAHVGIGCAHGGDAARDAAHGR